MKPIKQDNREIKEKEVKYSSLEDTKKHIKRVGDLLSIAISIFLDKIERHDLSKLEEPEKEIFDEYTPKLKNSTYGSEEYKSFLRGMSVALQHHYNENRHHPEHFKNGINGMDLIDIVEMVVDWKAASERHKDGDIYKSLEIQKDRFNISPQLVEIIRNTIQNIEKLDVK